MSPEAPPQIFVLLLGLTALGVVAATFAESDLTHPSELAPELVDPGVASPEESAEGSGRDPEVEPGAVDFPSARGPSTDGSGAAARAAEGSGAVDPIDGAEASADSLGGAANGSPSAAAVAGDNWEPLRRSDGGDPCLIRLNRLTMATSMERREPRGTEGPFVANGEPLFVFMDFANSTGVSQAVSVVWREADGTASHIDEIEAGPGSRWRTWTQRPLRLDQLGQWTVQVVDSERCLVDSVEFNLTAPDW